VIFSQAYYKSKDNIQISTGINVNIYSYITKPFIEKINSKSDSIVHNSDYINELFVTYGVNSLIYKNIFNEYNISSISVLNKNLDDKIFLSTAIQNNINISIFSQLSYKIVSIIKLIISVFISIVLSFLIPIYILFKYKNKHQDNLNNISVIRTKAADEKISKLQKRFNIDFFVDDIVYKNTQYTSMYSTNIIVRFKGIAVVPFINLRDIVFFMKDINKLFDKYMVGYIFYQYMLRIPIKSVYEYYLNNLINFSKGTYYTGNKEDRYAICEKRLSKKYNIKSVCFPHGLEYAFKMPAGLVGDTFYSISPESKEHLSNIYKKVNFVYDIDVISKMFKKNIDIQTNKKIVFFTEARDLKDVIINKKIIDAMLNKHFEVFLKLHPQDKLDNYKEYTNKISVLDNINDAINNNICISRKSTILVEALYNDSIAIAILINDLDKNMMENYFPSLTDKRILKFYNLEDMIKYIQIKNNKGIIDVQK